MSLALPDYVWLRMLWLCLAGKAAVTAAAAARCAAQPLTLAPRPNATTRASTNPNPNTTHTMRGGQVRQMMVVSQVSTAAQLLTLPATANDML